MNQDTKMHFRILLDGFKNIENDRIQAADFFGEEYKEDDFIDAVSRHCHRVLKMIDNHKEQEEM